jgi:glycerol-3-phosphate acyltransferase PlsY
MKCSKTTSHIFAYLHSFAVLFVILSTVYNIFYLKNADELTKNISLIVIIRILMRLPNQICISFNDSNGWVSVAESVVSLASVLIMNYYVEKHKKNINQLKETN